MLLMQANPLQGQVVEGWSLEFETFWALWNDIELLGECHLGPKKVEISRAQPHPTCPRNGFARMENITYGASK
jgi:hypothetical protein